MLSYTGFFETQVSCLLSLDFLLKLSFHICSYKIRVLILRVSSSMCSTCQHRCHSSLSALISCWLKYRMLADAGSRVTWSYWIRPVDEWCFLVTGLQKAMCVPLMACSLTQRNKPCFSKAWLLSKRKHVRHFRWLCGLSSGVSAVQITKIAWG